jgi:DNA-binding beta-propeller fold protein YncE
MSRWLIALVVFALAACGGDPIQVNPRVHEPDTPEQSEVPASAPEPVEPVPDPGRLDFLRRADSTRAVALDSGFDPLYWGKGPFDPPYVPGENQLTVLGDLGGEMHVERTIPLRDEGVVYVFSLSPDGDTAVAAAYVDPAYELIFVRGLRTAQPGVSRVLAMERQPCCFAFSPDGTWVAVGTSGLFSEEVGIRIVTGLPDDPVLEGFIDLGTDAGMPGFPGVYSLDVSLDARRILAKKVFDDCKSPTNSRAEVQVVTDALLGAVARVGPPLVLPQESAIPPRAPWEGEPTGVAFTEAGLLPDGDTAVVPSFGWSLSQPDARIFVVRGIRAGTPRIVRTLGPEDGVDPWPKGVAVCPDGDSALVANLLSGTVTRISGLSHATLDAIEVERIPVGQIAAYADITPDGRVVLIANGQGPIDHSPEPLVTSHSFEGNVLFPAHAAVTGPIHMAPYWPDTGFETWSPGFSDYVDAFLPSGLGAPLEEAIDRAIGLADEGRDADARFALDGVRAAVEALRGTGDLESHEAYVLDTLAALGQERLRP